MVVHTVLRGEHTHAEVTFHFHVVRKKVVDRHNECATTFLIIINLSIAFASQRRECNELLIFLRARINDEDKALEFEDLLL